MIIKLLIRAINYFRKTRARLGSNTTRINYLKGLGVKIGEKCLIFSIDFSTEPYLIEIGNHVVIANSAKFITHDGSTWLFRNEFPNMTVFGRIIIKDNTFIGTNCTLLPGTEIGANCIIGAGSVVRGIIPDNSVVMGNPAKVVMNSNIAKIVLTKNKNRVDTKNMNSVQRKEALLKHFFPINKQE